MFLSETWPVKVNAALFQPTLPGIFQDNLDVSCHRGLSDVLARILLPD